MPEIAQAQIALNFVQESLQTHRRCKDADTKILVKCTVFAEIMVLLPAERKLLKTAQ